MLDGVITENRNALQFNPGALAKPCGLARIALNKCLVGHSTYRLLTIATYSIDSLCGFATGFRSDSKAEVDVAIFVVVKRNR